MVAQDPSGFPQSFQFSNYSNLSASGPDLQRIKELNRTANVDDLQSCLKPLDNQRVRTSEGEDSEGNSSDFRRLDKFTRLIEVRTTNRFLKHDGSVSFSSYPACVLALVIPRVDIFTSRYSIADKICVAVITDFFVTDDPAGPGVHVCL